MSGAAKSNVLMFLAAMCAVGTVWLAVIAWRAYRALLRELDAQERRT